MHSLKLILLSEIQDHDNDIVLVSKDLANQHCLFSMIRHLMNLGSIYVLNLAKH